jgi:hypothetical protein
VRETMDDDLFLLSLLQLSFLTFGKAATCGRPPPSPPGRLPTPPTRPSQPAASLVLIHNVPIENPSAPPTDPARPPRGTEREMDGQVGRRPSRIIRGDDGDHP